MNDYQVIFQKRAADYHYAMQQFPEARKHEFDNLFSGINFENEIHLLVLIEIKIKNLKL